MGGLEGNLFGEFVKAFTAGVLALRANAENIVSSVQVLSLSSSFPCFRDKDGAAIIDKLRSRFRCRPFSHSPNPSLILGNLTLSTGATYP